jgi:hypothetical protein
VLLLIIYDIKRYINVRVLTCRQTLCSPALKQVVDERLIMWGGSTDHAEAYNLSQVLRVTRFPFLALLVCQSGRSVQLIDRIQGKGSSSRSSSRSRGVS